MSYALITDGVVSQIQPNKQDGFIKVDNFVVCGMTTDGNNFTSPPIPEKTTQQKIDDLENSITIRNIYGYNNGDQYAIKKIDAAFAEIELLRAEL